VHLLIGQHVNIGCKTSHFSSILGFIKKGSILILAYSYLLGFRNCDRTLGLVTSVKDED